MSNKKPIVFEYTFLIDEGLKTFTLTLDGEWLGLVREAPENLPEWTELGCEQCDNCPLSVDSTPHCPIAVNIVELVDFFGDAMSYEEVDVRISTDERSYVKHTTVSEALSSLLGVYMITSGCPIMDRLRPMASSEETTFRAIAMYLVAQYFKHRRGETPDWDLKGLPDIYRELHTVNKQFADRIRRAVDSDAGPNAVACLLYFALTLLSPSVRAQKWPHWGGPNTNFKLHDVGAFSKDEDFSLRVTWKRTLGSGYSSVSVANGIAVTIYSDGENDYVIALDAKDGSDIWRHRIGPAYLGHWGSQNGPLSTPLITDTFVVALSPQGLLFVLDRATGDPKWSIDIVEEQDGRPPFWGFTTSPRLAGDLVIVQSGGPRATQSQHTNLHPARSCGRPRPTMSTTSRRTASIESPVKTTSSSTGTSDSSASTQ